MDELLYELKLAPWPSCEEACSRIRRQVFIREQAVPEEDEWDGRDDTATHFVILERGTAQAVACARLLANTDSVKVTRMAVLREHRRQGLGRALLEAMLREAEKPGCKRAELDAQLQAASFYKKAGFHEVGKPFLDAGIQHIKMIKERV